MKRRIEIDGLPTELIAQAISVVIAAGLIPLLVDRAGIASSYSSALMVASLVVLSAVLVAWKYYRKHNASSLPGTIHDSHAVERPRLLVVDDKKYSHVDRLAGDGYNVTSKSDIKSLSEIERFQWDLILLDLHGIGSHISSDGGGGILQYIKEKAPTQLVVAYTARSDHPDRFRPIFDKANDFLNKDVDYLELKEAIDKNLAKLSTVNHYLDQAPQDLKRQQRAALEDIIGRAIAGEPVDETSKQLLSQLSNGQRAAVSTIISHATKSGARKIGR